MRLVRFSVTKLGPFAAPFQIEFDPNVTILTGANDAGKTSALRVLRMGLTNELANERDTNRDHAFAATQAWTKDASYTIKTDFELTEQHEVINAKPKKYPVSATITRSPAPNINSSSQRLTDGVNTWEQSNVHFNPPVCVSIGFDEKTETIRPILSLDNLNSLEASLLHIAFGGKFNFEKHRAFSLDAREESISAAQDRLNEQARRVLPRSDYFRFGLRSVDDAGTKLTVSIRDAQQASTPFDFRGNGARKMVAILARLLVEGMTAAHRIVLIDEPENSLHADAQHLLREFLYDLTRDGRTQVIYATHSPCMLNPMRPQQVRLLKRTRIKDLPTTVVVPRPEDLGFSAVRACWGLTAVDSLLYAPVTVIVEGATEVNCIPLLCTKLADEKIDGFDEQDRLLGLSYFVAGRGQNYAVVAKLAEAQGTRVLVLLDGDNHAADQKKKLQKEVPTARLILLSEGSEFENLVPAIRYFEALSRVLELGAGPELAEKFSAWQMTHAQFARASFTKQVSKWLTDEFPEKELEECKPDVMIKAVEITPAAEVTIEPLVELLKAIRAQLTPTSFAR
jgi:predicted ATPase